MGKHFGSLPLVPPKSKEKNRNPICLLIKHLKQSRAFLFTVVLTEKPVRGARYMSSIIISTAKKEMDQSNLAPEKKLLREYRNSRPQQTSSILPKRKKGNRMAKKKKMQLPNEKTTHVTVKQPKETRSC